MTNRFRDKFANTAEAKAEHKQYLAEQEKAELSAGDEQLKSGKAPDAPGTADAVTTETPAPTPPEPEPEPEPADEPDEAPDPETISA